jgi:hypothetical protein
MTLPRGAIAKTVKTLLRRLRSDNCPRNQGAKTSRNPAETAAFSATPTIITATTALKSCMLRVAEEQNYPHEAIFFSMDVRISELSRRRRRRLFVTPFVRGVVTS